MAVGHPQNHEIEKPGNPVIDLNHIPYGTLADFHKAIEELFRSVHSFIINSMCTNICSVPNHTVAIHPKKPEDMAKIVRIAPKYKMIISNTPEERVWKEIPRLV